MNTSAMYPTKKWAPRPLTKTCGVCGDPATDVQHYGSIVCYSCRAFFRRSIGCSKEYGICVRGTDSCVVDQVTRTNCKRCRFRKCLLIGMKSGKVDMSRGKGHASQTFDKKRKCSTESIPSVPTKYQANEIQSSESSKEHGNNLTNMDIENLAEECVLEESKLVKKLISRNKEDQDATSFCTLSLKAPVVDFTLEEEFRVYELEAMKENLFNGCFKIGLGFPKFLDNISEALISLSQGADCGFSKERVLSFHRKTRNYLRQEMGKGGVFRTLLDSSFYVFNNVPDEIRIETFRFSLGVVDLSMRAFMKGNSDKEFFIEQRKAAGIQNATLQRIVEHIFPENRNALKSLDDYAIAIFKSPWARNLEDEEFFQRTLQTVGEIVKDDVKLGTIYIFLVLATPSVDLSLASKTDPALAHVQQDLTMLLYRYLKNKHRDTDMASNTLNRLLQMIGDLHRCRNIHLFGRIE